MTPHHHDTRTLRRTAAFLLAGFVSAIVVSCLCAAWPGTTRGGTCSFAVGSEPGQDLAVVRYPYTRAIHINSTAGLLHEPYISWQSSNAGPPESLVPSWAHSEVIPWGVTTPWSGYDGRTLVATGWPLPAMYTTFDPVPNPIGYWTWKPRSGWRLPDTMQPPEVLNFGQAPRMLPARFIWHALAVNTAFYAIMIWLVWTIPLAWRRRRRIARGLCAACAYPVGVSKTCSECGSAVSPKS